MNAEQTAVSIAKQKKKIKWWYPAKGERHIEHRQWVSVYFRKFKNPTISFRWSPATYFDNRACIHMNLLWVSLWFHFPIYSTINECEYPEFGFYYHSNSLVLCWNMKKKFIHMPWDYTWVRTSALKKDGTWEHETVGNRKKFYEDKWKDVLWTETYHYPYVCNDGTIQDDIDATVQVREREWRPRWFKWTKLFRKVSKDIDVNFNNEVGNQRGSWKGGTIGCGYQMKEGETPLKTLRRMQRERSFCR